MHIADIITYDYMHQPKCVNYQNPGQSILPVRNHKDK